VVTGSASRTYNGSALTASGSVSGLVNGETVAFAVTGSQTAVGMSPNSYRLEWTGTVKESNYEVKESVGTLTVTQRTSGGGITPTPTPRPDPAPAPAPTPGTTIIDQEVPLAGAVGLNDTDHFAYVIGYDEDHVRPLANITRAEFAAIAARFLDDSHVDDGKGDFSDTADHWAASYIRLAAKAGWINGNGNRFDPEDFITRAQVMTIVNRMLDRTPDEGHMLPEMKKWADNPEDAWYYEAVQEAANEHDYNRDEVNVETWTVLKEGTDWAALELGWAANNGAPASKAEDAGSGDTQS
jgi:hypothetical protein